MFRVSAGQESPWNSIVVMKTYEFWFQSWKNENFEFDREINMSFDFSLGNLWISISIMKYTNFDCCHKKLQNSISIIIIKKIEFGCEKCEFWFQSWKINEFRFLSWEITNFGFSHEKLRILILVMHFISIFKKNYRNFVVFLIGRKFLFCKNSFMNLKLHFFMFLNF